MWVCDGAVTGERVEYWLRVGCEGEPLLIALEHQVSGQRHRDGRMVAAQGRKVAERIVSCESAVDSDVRKQCAE